MKIQKPHFESHEDLPLIIELAQESGVEAEDLILNSDLLEGLDQLHETRQRFRENALRLTLCDELKDEMIDMEKGVSKSQIRNTIRDYRKRMSLMQAAEQEFAA